MQSQRTHPARGYGLWFSATGLFLLAMGVWLWRDLDAAASLDGPAAGHGGSIGGATGVLAVPTVGSELEPRERVAPGTIRVVHVVDADGSEPIADADVRCCVRADGDNEWSTVRSAADGTAVCDGRGRGILIAVTATGYAPVVEPWHANELEHTVRMARAASLRLHFVDAADRPVRGVMTRLLTPQVQGPAWAFDWQVESDAAAWEEPLLGAIRGDLGARFASGIHLTGERVIAPMHDCLRERLTAAVPSDDEGLVEYVGLPAGEGWRWGLLSSHLVDMTPLHESSPMRADPRGLRATLARRIDSLSGAVTLVAGATLALTVRVHGKGTVRGRFPTVATALRPQVKLFQLTSTDPDSKVRAVDVSMEAFVAAGEDGAFCFVGVRPGKKVVRAFWRTSAVDYVFTTATGVLADDGDLDLGLIEPVAGELVARIDVLDRQQHTVSLASVLDDADPSALLNIGSWNAANSLTQSTQEIIRVPLAMAVRLHGLAGDRVRLRSVCNLDWPDPRPTQRLLDSSAIELRLPRSDVAEVPLRLEERFARELTIAAPTALRPPLDLWLRPIRGGDPERLRVPAGAGDATVQLSALAEPYELLVSSVAGIRTEPWVGNATVDFSSSSSASLSLQAGAVVRGRCRTAAGAPLANARLLWTRPGWCKGANSVWLFDAATDGEGRFAIAGLPPGVELRGSRPGTSLQAPAAGGVAEVDLLVQR